MASTALVWFRRDLRVHDHPALMAAAAGHDRVVPVFVLDRRLLHGRFPSAPRAGFLLASLAELRASLRERGADLVVRDGRPEEVLPRLAAETGAETVLFASDVSPFAMLRDRRTEAALREAGVEVARQPGNFIADVGKPRTKDGRPFAVFTPFWRAWAQLPLRDVLDPPDALAFPGGLDPGELPTLAGLGSGEPGLSEPMVPGEAAGRARADEFLATQIADYAEHHDRLAGGTSELSPYLHFGCLSARELHARASALDGDGPRAYARQLAWRDFYAHVLLHHPANAHRPFQERFMALETHDDPAAYDAWCEGRTGFPVVDAGMRQLRARGWMHNRARLITGSFLTKDLHLDYRLGEAHFMRWLLCGDEAQNNGNWQWIASVGVDPAPAFRRMFNPTLQQRKFDPDGEYVRRWVPELRQVPDDRLAEPWTMSPDEQRDAGCVIGEDYPEPIVDHRAEREVALERYRSAQS